MRAYELYIDDELAITGVFEEVFGPTRVSWGDVVTGATSLTEWDYVRFGVIPEPSSFLAFILVLVSARAATRVRPARSAFGPWEDSLSGDKGSVKP
jgi:hypothetical protein